MAANTPFDVVTALHKLATLSHDVEVNIRIVDNDMRIRLSVGQERIENVIPMEQLANQRSGTLTFNTIDYIGRMLGSMTRFKKLLSSLKAV